MCAWSWGDSAFGSHENEAKCLTHDMPKCLGLPVVVIGTEDGSCEGYNWYPGCKDRDGDDSGYSPGNGAGSGEQSSNSGPQQPAPMPNPDEDCHRAGNPVIIATGQKIQTEIDFTDHSEAQMPLNFVRYYRAGQKGTLGLAGIGILQCVFVLPDLLYSHWSMWFAHQLHCLCSWLPHAVSLSVLDNLQQIHRCHIPCRRQLSSPTLCFAWRASSCLHPILGWCSPQSPLRRRLDHCDSLSADAPYDRALIPCLYPCEIAAHRH